MTENEIKTNKNMENNSGPKEKQESDKLMKRRKFFKVSGWLAFFSFLGTVTIGSIRFLFPRVLYEPSPVFLAGLPEEYLVDMISTKWVKDYLVFIIRDKEGIYALSAICTHLGCTPIWQEIEHKFKCPCHGSGFHVDGINFEGPAPRPLERLKITLAEDGQIEIDRSIKYLYERGEWQKPGAVLQV